MRDGWKEVHAEEFCVSVRDGTHDSPKAVDAGADGYHLITSKHLNDYHLDFINAYKISECDFTKINERSEVEQWDILFSMIGTIGKVYQEKSSTINYAIKNVGLFKMGGDEQKSNWLKYYLLSPKSRNYIASHLRGSTQSYVPLGSLRKMASHTSAAPRTTRHCSHALLPR